MHQILLEPYLTGAGALDTWNVINEAKYGHMDNLVSPKPFQKPHMAAVNSLALNSTKQLMLSGGADSSIKLWDLEQSPKLEHTIPAKTVHQFGVTHLKWWPDDGMWLSSSFDFTLKLFDSQTMAPVHSFNLESRVLNFDFDPSGSSSLVACCLDGGVGGIKMVDLRTLADSQVFGGGGKARGGYGYMLSCAWSPTDPNILVSGGQDGYCVVWDIRSSNGSLATLDYNLTTTNYKASDRHLHFYEDTPRAHNGGINSILFNDTGTELITLGTDERIRVWDLTSDTKPLNKSINFGPLIRNKSSQYVQMCLSPSLETEIQYLWFPSETGEILIYHVTDGRLVARLSRWRNGQRNSRIFSLVYTGHNSLRYYAGCRDGSISTWGYSPQKHTDPAFFDNGIDYDDEKNPKTVLDKIHDEMINTD